MATNRVPEVNAVAVVFLTLTWVTSGLRCDVKGFMTKSFGLEDWLAMLAQVLFTLTACLALEGIAHSMGKHLIEIPLQNLAPAMVFSTELAYTMTTGALKLSIAVFLLPIANQKSHRIILYNVMSLVTLLTTSYLLFLVFQCSPVSYFWLQFNGLPGSCLSNFTVGEMTYTHSAVNAFADVILAFLPVFIFSRLQMNIRTKITVSAILSLGVVAAIAVIIRIPYVKVLVDNANDFLFSSTNVVMWSAIEPGLAITAANMATLRPLFQAFLSRTKLFGSTSNTRGKSTGTRYRYGGHSHSHSRGGVGGKKGYFRSESEGLDGDGKSDEVQLNDMDHEGNEDGSVKERVMKYN